MPAVHHEKVHFSGRVQGVGFRYAALQVAKEFEISGYVQNLPDGRVILEAEGQPAEVDRFVAAVTDRMHGFIRQAERNGTQRDAQFSGFTIR